MLHYLKNFLYSIFLILIPLFLLSSFLIYEISQELFFKQMIYYSIAFIIFLVTLIIPWRAIFNWFIPLLYIINLALLISVEFIGKTILGAKRWIEIPFAHITIQPSEFMKISVILMLAHIISKNPPKKSGYGLKYFTILSLVILIPFLLIAKEPDLGTALVLLIMGYGILFVIGINWKIWVSLLIILGVLAPILYGQLKPYQKKRVTDFLGTPSYHVKQALIAIGSGGENGQKKEEATQTHLKFLPVSSTDFIFAYLGERFGLKGVFLTIALYIVLIINLLYLSYLYENYYYINTISIGLSFLIFIYMGVNIYMNIGLAPVVGLPLPMFSHGGSSFIIFISLFGILQSLIFSKRKASL